MRTRQRKTENEREREREREIPQAAPNGNKRRDKRVDAMSVHHEAQAAAATAATVAIDGSPKSNWPTVQQPNAK